MNIDILEAYLDIGSVPGEIGILPKYREVTGTPRESIGPMGLRGKERGAASMGRAPPPPLVRIGLGGGGVRGPLLAPSLFSLLAHVGPLTPRGVPVTSRYSGKNADFTRNHSDVQT